jgi:hypothetical protein
MSVRAEKLGISQGGSRYRGRGLDRQPENMNPASIARGLALLSVSGLSVAVAATVLGHIGLGPGFDPLALTVSDYALSDRGAVIEAAMMALAGASLALIAGLTAARAPVRGLPTFLLLIWAVGLLVAAAVPTDPIGTPVMSTAALVHRYASVAAFVCLPGAALVLASRFAAEEAWSTLSGPLRRLATASGVGLALLLYVAFPGGRVLMGLVERALIAVEVVVLLVLALHLFAAAHHDRARGPIEPAATAARAGGGAALAQRDALTFATGTGSASRWRSRRRVARSRPRRPRRTAPSTTCTQPS